jgi:acyl carrier protein
MMERIKAIIADALYCDAQDVNPETNLMRDLGAESIDFLDIIFRLEKEFSIKIPKGEIERRAKGKLSDEQFAINSLLTEDGLQQLRLAMPEVDREEIRSGLYVRDIPTLFRVATFERMVREQVAAKASTKSGVETSIGVAAVAAN